MNEAETKILNWFRSRGELALSGNREDFALLKFSEGKYLFIMGDSVTNEIIVSSEQTEEETLSRLILHFTSKARDYTSKEPADAGDVWEFICSWYNLDTDKG